LSVRNGATVFDNTQGEGNAGELNIDTSGGIIEVIGISSDGVGSDIGSVSGSTARGAANEWLVDSRGQVHLVATNEAHYIPPKVNVCPN
jgi:hypothetical protein